MVTKKSEPNKAQQKQEIVRTLLAGSNPYCIMPGEYFEEICKNDGSVHKKMMLSIQSWDGREIFTLERIGDKAA